MACVLDLSVGAQNLLIHTPAETLGLIDTNQQSLPTSREYSSLLFAQDLFIRNSPVEEKVFIDAAGLAFWMLRESHTEAGVIATQSRVVTFGDEVERAIRNDRRIAPNIMHLLGASNLQRHPETQAACDHIGAAYRYYPATAPYATLAMDAFGIGLYIVDNAAEIYAKIAAPLFSMQLEEWLESV